MSEYDSVPVYETNDEKELRERIALARAIVAALIAADPTCAAACLRKDRLNDVLREAVRNGTPSEATLKGHLVVHAAAHPSDFHTPPRGVRPWALEKLTPEEKLSLAAWQAKCEEPQVAAQPQKAAPMTPDELQAFAKLTPQLKLELANRRGGQ